MLDQAKPVHSLNLIKLNPMDFTDPNHYSFYYLYNHPANNPWMYFATRSPQEFQAVCASFFAEKDAIYLLQQSGCVPAKILGVCVAKKLLPPRQHVIEITSVVIAPECHGQGYGKKLLALLKLQLAQDFPEVWRYELSYGANNPVAYCQRFYAKNGFKDEAIWHDYFRSKAPSYGGETQQIYQTWLMANGGDLRHIKNFWYADEIVAANFTIPLSAVPNYQPLPLGWWQHLVLPSATANDLILRQANAHDIGICTQYYLASDTEWGFIDEANLTKILQDKISQQQLWLVTRKQVILGMCCLTIAPYSLEHTVLLEQVIVMAKDSAISAFLLQSLLILIKSNFTKIKRLEMRVTDEEGHLAAALSAQGFQYTGTLQCRIKTKQQRFLDEHVFEKTLFNLAYTIELCQARLAAEQFFQQHPTIAYPFNLRLETAYLERLLVKLKNLTQAQFNEGIYQSIKIICTQDAVSVEKRLKAIKKLLL